MFKKTISYKNFNDEERTKDFYFHLTKSELLELAGAGGMQERVNRMIATQDQVAIMQELRSIVNLAIGVRSEDGETFIKNDEIRAQLMFSPAYDELLMSLMMDPNAAAEFINNLMPKDMQEKLKEELKKVQLPAAPDLFAEPPNPTSKQAMQEPENAEKPDAGLPAWFQEGRKPTRAELMAMSQAEMNLAFKMTQEGRLK
jgi:hypothetical protein